MPYQEETMKLLVAIHKDEGSVYGVAVPDIPGCFSWGDTIEHALKNTGEAICAHLQTMRDEGLPFHVEPSDMDDLEQQEQFVDVLWARIEVDF
jgi:predicted RNase H-like HicB family nuclease